MLERIKTYLTDQVSASTLVLFRICFGGIMLWEVTRYFPRIERYYLTNPMLFTYDFFHWVKPWSGEGLYIHFAIAGIAALFVSIGFLYRLSATIVFLSFSYFFLLEQVNYLNHIYFVNLVGFLLIFTNANSRFSLDSYLWKKLRSDTVPRWNVTLIQFQIGLVYFFGGVAKINMDWLQGEPLRNWLAKRGHFDYIGPYLTEWWSPYFFSWGGLALDLFVPFLLLYKPTRIPAVLSVLFFHLFNTWIFTIGIFPWMMLAATIIFFEPDYLERFIPKTGQTNEYRSTSPLLVPLISVYVFFQLFLPLRHWLIPGEVVWTEEGHKFAWRMKLRDKDARLTLFVTDPKTKRRMIIHPVRSRHVTSRQFSKMTGRPDMFFQYIQFLKKKLKEKHNIDNPIINARYMVSVNGRPFQWMVDPKRNLAEITYSPFTPSDWLLPMKRDQPIGDYSRNKPSPQPL